MRAPSTYLDRSLRVAERTTIRVAWIHDDGTIIQTGPVLHGVRFTVDPPYTCEPGVDYRLALDLDTLTATIREAGAA